VPVGDVCGLVQAMRRLATAPGECEHWRQHGRKRAEEVYSIDRITDEYLQLYAGLLKACTDQPSEGLGKRKTCLWFLCCTVYACLQWLVLDKQVALAAVGDMTLYDLQGVCELLQLKKDELAQ
jgi:hypothetical protein